MADVLAQLKGLWENLNGRQRITLVVSTIAAAAVIGAAVLWTGRTEYAVLYSGLNSEDAGRIVESLQKDGIAYRLGASGSTIYVPSNQVYETRIGLASDGLPHKGSVGYEIFDQNNLGVSDFVQKLNYRRALEGELTRTIEQLDAIDAARVHIVIPKETIFLDDDRKVTASIVLWTNPIAAPGKREINGIANLVASSVEGLSREDVTIIDSSGRLLVDGGGGDEGLALSGEQIEIRRRSEEYLARKVQSMLDDVLGHGHSAVRVSAEIDFRRVEKMVESYDPDNTVVRSEERNEEMPVGIGSGEAAGVRRENSVTNYEINKTVENVVESVGNIQRLNVAVLVDNRKEKGEDGEMASVPRTEEELAKIRELVENAIGADPSRNDNVVVVNLPFDRMELEEENRIVEKEQTKLFVYETIRKLVPVLLIGLLLLYLRRTIGRVGVSATATAGPQAGAGAPGADGTMQPSPVEAPGAEPVLAEVGAAAPEAGNGKYEEIREISRTQPDVVVGLIKSWLSES
jgi:flagellar M-ring protein FliF